MASSKIVISAHILPPTKRLYVVAHDNSSCMFPELVSADRSPGRTCAYQHFDESMFIMMCFFVFSDFFYSCLYQYSCMMSCSYDLLSRPICGLVFPGLFLSQSCVYDRIHSETLICKGGRVERVRCPVPDVVWRASFLPTLVPFFSLTLICLPSDLKYFALFHVCSVKNLSCSFIVSSVISS